MFYIYIQCPIERHGLFTAVCGVTDLRWLCSQCRNNNIILFRLKTTLLLKVKAVTCFGELKEPPSGRNINKIKNEGLLLHSIARAVNLYMR